MDVAAVAETYLSEVEEFAAKIKAAADQDSRHDELRNISPLLRFAERFYTRFFMERYKITVSNFSYRDKREVSKKLVDEEDAVAEGKASNEARAALELGAYFEELT